MFLTRYTCMGYEDKVMYVWFDACIGYLRFSHNNTYRGPEAIVAQSRACQSIPKTGSSGGTTPSTSSYPLEARHRTILRYPQLLNSRHTLSTSDCEQLRLVKSSDLQHYSRWPHPMTTLHPYDSRGLPAPDARHRHHLGRHAALEC